MITVAGHEEVCINDRLPFGFWTNGSSTVVTWAVAFLLGRTPCYHVEGRVSLNVSSSSCADMWHYAGVNALSCEFYKYPDPPFLFICLFCEVRALLTSVQSSPRPNGFLFLASDNPKFPCRDFFLEVLVIIALCQFSLDPKVDRILNSTQTNLEAKAQDLVSATTTLEELRDALRVSEEGQEYTMSKLTEERQQSVTLMSRGVEQEAEVAEVRTRATKAEVGILAREAVEA